MKNNPFAKVFKDAFQEDVLDKSLIVLKNEEKHRPERLNKFIGSLNKFLISCEEPPVNTSKHIINELNVIEYANFLRGYMRNSQDILNNIKNKFTYDDDLIKLFNKASNYLVACNNKVEGNHKIFSNDVGYKLWKFENKKSLENATFETCDYKANPNKKNLFMLMPFRIKNDEDTLKRMFFNNMRQSLDNQNFEDVDKYVAFFPIEKSRASKVYSTLKTIKNPDTYTEKADIDFVKKHFIDFIAKDVKLDKDSNITSATNYSEKQLINNFKNITIFGYCASSADAHRCSTVIKKMTTELYGEKTANKAIKELCILNYGFLPIQKKPSYSSVYFISNLSNDTNKVEPFAKLNNPELYDKVKYRQNNLPAKITCINQNSSYIVAFKLAENNIIVENNKLKDFNDAEFGHNPINITTQNILSDNFAQTQFRTVLQNATLGKRGIDMFSICKQPKYAPIVLVPIINKQCR